MHHVVGNHCLSVERAALLQRLGICASYRKLPIAPGWRLIILDTTVHMVFLLVPPAVTYPKS